MALLPPGSRMRSPLGRAIGLGSAKEGVEHWWALRITSIALVPLTLWFVIAIVQLAGADRAVFVDWVRRPIPAVLLILLIATTFYHGALGLQVVIEDYVHHEGMKLALILLEKFASVVLAAAALFAVLKIAVGGY